MKANVGNRNKKDRCNTQITKIRRDQRAKTQVPTHGRWNAGHCHWCLHASFSRRSSNVLFPKKTFKRADQMDIFSKQYMWRIKGGHGALKMFLTHRFYSWYIVFHFLLSQVWVFLLPVVPAPSLSWFSSFTFLPSSDLELLISLLTLLSVFNLPYWQLCCTSQIVCVIQHLKVLPDWCLKQEGPAAGAKRKFP